MSEKKKKIPVFRALIFIIILIALVLPTQFLLQYRERQYDNSSFQIINFYKEEKNSLDAVFIGSSCVFAYYSPLFAYNSHGILTSNFASSGMSIIAYKYAIEEVRKTQEDALIVLTYTSNDNMSYSSVHYMADYMPLSPNKIRFLLAYLGREGGGVLDTVEWLVPMLRYHSRWNEIDADDFVIDDGTKGATAHEYYLNLVTDITADYYPTSKTGEITDGDILEDLLDYLDENEVRVLFLIPPRGYKEEDNAGINAAYELMVSRGFEVLDMREKREEIGLDFAHDYYDKYHTNIHGSIKYTDFVASYIMDNYGISGLKDDDSFNNAWEKYLKKIRSYVSDQELTSEKTGNMLAANGETEVSES